MQGMQGMDQVSKHTLINNHRVVVFGAHGVGKSCLVTRFVQV